MGEDGQGRSAEESGRDLREVSSFVGQASRPVRIASFFRVNEMQSLIRHRNLPHWDVPGATYFITSCLDGSIPALGLLDIANYARELETRSQPIGLSGAEWQDRRLKLIFGRTDHWLDSARAARHFERADLARVAVDSMFHFAGERYDLLAFAVIPSHIHWVFRPLESWVESLGSTVDKWSPRERIMHSLKTFTAQNCNRASQVHGRFWQEESYDRCVRDDAELERIVVYVEQNPVVAGLVADAVEYPFSSAAYRMRKGTALGEPLPL